MIKVIKACHAEQRQSTLCRAPLVTDMPRCAITPRKMRPVMTEMWSSLTLLQLSTSKEFERPSFPSLRQDMGTSNQCFPGDRATLSSRHYYRLTLQNPKLRK